MKKIRLTMAQALLRFLDSQYVETLTQILLRKVLFLKLHNP